MGTLVLCIYIYYQHSWVAVVMQRAERLVWVQAVPGLAAPRPAVGEGEAAIGAEAAAVALGKRKLDADLSRLEIREREMQCDKLKIEAQNKKIATATHCMQVLSSLDTSWRQDVDLVNLLKAYLRDSLAGDGDDGLHAG